MKKITLLLMLVISLGFAENKFYLAAGVGSGSGEYIYSDTSGLNEEHESNQELADIKFGVIIEHNNRIEFSISKLEIDVINPSILDKTVTSINADFILTLDFEEANPILLPFLTIGAGYSVWDGSTSITKDNTVIMGSSINYGVGVYLSLSHSVDLEIAYKGKKIIWQDMVDTNGNILSLEEDVALTYIGLQFHF